MCSYYVNKFNIFSFRYHRITSLPVVKEGALCRACPDGRKVYTLQVRSARCPVLVVGRSTLCRLGRYVVQFWWSGRLNSTGQVSTLSSPDGREVDTLQQVNMLSSPDGREVDTLQGRSTCCPVLMVGRSTLCRAGQHVVQSLWSGRLNSTGQVSTLSSPDGREVDTLQGRSACCPALMVGRSTLCRADQHVVQSLWSGGRHSAG